MLLDGFFLASGCGHRFAMALLQNFTEKGDGAHHAFVCQIGQRAGGFHGGGKTQNITPDNLHHTTAAQNTQGFMPVVFAFCVSGQLIQPVTDDAAGQWIADAVAADRLIKPGSFARQGFGHVLTDGQHFLRRCLLFG